MAKGCGVLTKGNHANDDLVPCGTRLWLFQDKKADRESTLLCPKCKEQGN